MEVELFDEAAEEGEDVAGGEGESIGVHGDVEGHGGVGNVEVVARTPERIIVSCVLIDRSTTARDPMKEGVD